MMPPTDDESGRPVVVRSRITPDESYSVRNAAALPFERVGIAALEHVLLDPGFVRPAAAESRTGKAASIRAMLGWEPETVTPSLPARIVGAGLDAFDSSSGY